MLQSLLQPRDNQRSKMIGAMPAVAVRHERRRAEKRGGGGRRPSQLPLQLGRAPDAEATPSPDHHRLRNEIYVCGKYAQVAALHAVVGSLLLGIVVLVVGLVQLSPGAEAAQHRYYLMGAGGAMVGTGVLGAVLRCVCLHWYNRKFRQEIEDDPDLNTHKNGVSVVESHDPKSALHDPKAHEHKAGHEQKGHDQKGHEQKGHEQKGHEQKGHEQKGHEQKGHEQKGHEQKGHEQKGHEHKGHEKVGHEHKPAETHKPKLKAQASIRDVDLIKQPSAASDT